MQREYKYGRPINREVDSRPWNIWGQFVLGEPQVRTHKEMRLMLTQPLKVQFVLTIDCEQRQYSQYCILMYFVKTF